MNKVLPVVTVRFMAVMLVAVDLQIGVVRRKPASPLPQPTTHRRRAPQGRRADGARGILCRSPADFFSLPHAENPPKQRRRLAVLSTTAHWAALRHEQA